MEPQQVTTMAHKFQAVLDADVLNERGKDLGFAKRERRITPFRLGLSVTASMASQQVRTIADLHRQFNELWEIDTDYKAFYKQLLKSTSPEFFRTSLSHIMSQLTMKVLGFEAGAAFSEFNRLILQDGSSFALHEALRHVFPGRFNAVSPAAVELHCTLDLLQDALITIYLSPDTDSEHDYRPEPQSLRGDLLLADRGYLDLTYLRDIDRQGGLCRWRGGGLLLWVTGVLGGWLSAQTPRPIVYVAPINGMIDLGLAPFVDRVLTEATRANATAVILEINTFGGRVDAAILIRDALLRAPVRTVAFVNKQAISAGALIALSAETIVMADASTIGAAIPVQMGGGAQ